jgi:LysM repeat protein
MIHNIGLIIIFICSTLCFSSIQITYPNEYHITSSDRIDIHAVSSINQGFLMIEKRIIPVRKKTTFPNIPLSLGENNIIIHVLDNNLQIQPYLTTSITVYRQWPTHANVQKREAIIITDLIINHHIDILDGKNDSLESPILKKDVYALLMWFFNDNTATTLTYAYNDMKLESSYLEMYKRAPQWLPRPILNSFYPNAYITRESFINLLLLISGSADQISSSRMVEEKLTRPPALTTILPTNWTTPLTFVSKKEALHILATFFKFNAPRESSVTAIKWPNRSMNQVLLPELTTLKKTLHRHKKNALASIQSTLFSNHNEPTEKFLTNRPPTKVNTPATPPPTTFSIITVQKGDSIQRIAKEHYGNSSKWKPIVDYNKLQVKHVTINGELISTVHIEPGQRLKLPSSTTID